MTDGLTQACSMFAQLCIGRKLPVQSHTGMLCDPGQTSFGQAPCAVTVAQCG